MDSHESRSLESKVAESRAVPWLSVIFGWLAVVPPVVAAAAVWLLTGTAARLMTDLAIVYGGAFLAFLAGVRRGVSFRTMGGPTAGQITTVLWLFALGGAALALMLIPARALALVLLLGGHASLDLLDPIAARRGEAPLFFARLRPWQMSIAATAYALLLVREL